MPDNETFLTADEILSIPNHLCPMIVFSDSLRGFFSWAIKVHEKGNYNHAMILLPGGYVASQGMVYSKEKIKKYFDGYRLKLWYQPDWTRLERSRILTTIDIHLSKNWARRIYDVPAILGQLLPEWTGAANWCQVPGLEICSDSGAVLKMVDPEYDLKHPDPEEVNSWLEKHEKYKVYGRYVPD